MKLGFIGVVTTETTSSVFPSSVEEITFLKEIEAINKAAAELKQQGVKAIFVLAHIPGTSNANGEQAEGDIVNIAKAIDDEVDIIEALVQYIKTIQHPFSSHIEGRIQMKNN
ncbi:hypothetical protein [Bacillus sp. SA1-12]|uniref:hypothetical protein n=1 Tax=Bacillus sp. SA1-12 TaxID=1455638 RepID=UPI0006962EE4